MNFPLMVKTIRQRGVGYWMRRRGIGRASWRNLANFALNRYELKRKRTRLRSNPPAVQIEPTTACNLNCHFCGRQAAWSPLRENVSYLRKEVFLKMMPVLRTAREVSLHGWGEPLLHPDIVWMAETCKRQGAMVGFTTNGLPLSEKFSEDFVRIGLDWIHVSIDAARADTYAKVRGGDFNKLVANLKQLAEIKKRHKSHFPSVRFSFCLMKQNIDQISEIVDLAQECGVDEINFEHLIVYQKDLVKQTAFGLEEQVMAAYHAAEAKAASLGIITTFAGFARKKSEPGCPFSMFTMLTDGTVGFCGAQRALVGSVLDGGPLEIWNGPAFQGVRNRFATGQPLEQCQSCPNMTNAAVDFIQPDMSYVESTLGMRRWDETTLKNKKVKQPT